jgi:hypothetical protein
MTLGLGVLSLLAVIFGHLALTDIAHGEGDLSLEWNVLRVAALVIVMFIAVTFGTMSRVLRVINRS